ncbi:hypothetical protein SAMN03097699_0217 [Flavobacteriaceae bacterium MAR_2010_188]|nr:hypothetical protein SAMN03097699_0217 [Flavobacteriaceae bacterium MAR_2010_188]
MKILWLCFLGPVLFYQGYSQKAEIVAFRHDLRWVDETKFPNYFFYEEVRDSIFNVTKQEIASYLRLTEVKLPHDVSYKFIDGFGNQKTRLPKANPVNDYEVGLYSFITRGTVGSSVIWKLNIIIRKKDKIILTKEIAHELEYFNVSGYLTSIKWLEPTQFKDIFIRLLKESLGVLPASDEVIIIGSFDEQEAKAQALFKESTRHLLKIDGNWLSAGNFVAQLESPKDTILDFHYKEKVSWEFPKPSFSNILANLFSQMTGLEVFWEDLVTEEKKGVLIFSDGDELGISLRWVEIETTSTLSNEVESQRVVDPLLAEIYSKDRQIGYFVYTRNEIAFASNKMLDSNMYNGSQDTNQFGVERIHRIEGELNNKPIMAEYDESKGIIGVKSGKELLGVMLMENLNPDNRSISNSTLSKKKIFISEGQIGKSSLKKTKSAEWYPIYLPNDFSGMSGKICIETLIFLFFGIGNM